VVPPVLQPEPVEIRIAGIVILANGGGYGIDPAGFRGPGRREYAETSENDRQDAGKDCHDEPHVQNLVANNRIIQSCLS
jgi:hypothetical protein